MLIASVGRLIVSAGALVGSCLPLGGPWEAQNGDRLRALIVGGGPEPSHNQAAIESNVLYVDRLLPSSSPRRILFADGNAQSKIVLCAGADGKEYFRVPEIRKIDASASRQNVLSELKSAGEHASSDSATPVLLYFTGHGSPDNDGRFENNRFDLWNKEELSVKDLAASIKSFPKETPITLVMVECFSGAFGNVLFRDGDANGALDGHRICGFFACVSPRMAAGCTSEINQAEYRDFTSYFFAALTGKTRTGKSVRGADYDHDGHVEMDEAYAYTLIHDDSIDTPMCTSEVFLRRFVKTLDKDCMTRPFSSVRSWASPAQREALDALSSYLHQSGEDRAQKAYRDFLSMDFGSEQPTDVHLIRFVRLVKTVVLAHDLLTSNDEDLKKSYSALIADEHSNPLAL